jgi:hypothetical protein
VPAKNKVGPEEAAVKSIQEQSQDTVQESHEI